jgi:DNA-directed RNA polymerase specialized sigma24 family protein
VLNGRLQLHDIHDTEAYVHHLLRKGRWYHNLPPHQYEDLTTYLIAQAWELSTRYQPGGITFSTWAHTTLTKRITDWQRKTHTDTRYPSNTKYTTHPITDQLEHTLTHGPLDDPTHSAADHQRLHHQRDSSNDRPYPQPNTPPTQHAQTRTT